MSPEMEPTALAVHMWHDRKFGKKWRPHVIVVHPDSADGRRRIEVFADEKKMHKAQPEKVILLDNCYAVKNTIDNGQLHLRIQMRDETDHLMYANDNQILKELICCAAFPRTLVSLQAECGSMTSPSPTEENEPVFTEETEVDSFPVLLLVSTMPTPLSEGNFELRFDDTLHLTVGCDVAEQWAYEQVEWIAAGEHCLGFGTRDGGCCEFKCARPLQAVDAFRKRLRFSLSFPPLKQKTENAYSRTYWPCGLRGVANSFSDTASPSSSLDRTLNSDHAPRTSTPDRSQSSSVSGPSVSRSRLSDVVDSVVPLEKPMSPVPAARRLPPRPDTTAAAARFHLPAEVQYAVMNEPPTPGRSDESCAPTRIQISDAVSKVAMRPPSTTTGQRPPSERNSLIDGEEKTGFFGFLRRNSTKKRQTGRDNFEKDAKDEWMQYRAGQPEDDRSSIANALMFKQTMEQVYLMQEQEDRERAPSFDAPAAPMRNTPQRSSFQKELEQRLANIPAGNRRSLVIKSNRNSYAEPS